MYLRLLRVERPELIRSPEAYLFTVAANIVREYALRRSRQPMHVTLDTALIDETTAGNDALIAPGPEAAALRSTEVKQLERILDTLSPKARAALIWHRRDGLSYDEIGQRLGVSRNMVKKYLVKALAHCRKQRDELSKE